MEENNGHDIYSEVATYIAVLVVGAAIVLPVAYEHHFKSKPAQEVNLRDNSDSGLPAVIEGGGK